MGGISAAEIEGAADGLLRWAGDQAPGIVALAERLLGAGCVRAVHAGALPGVAAVARVGGNWRIYIRARASAEQQTFAIAHELAHWCLGETATETECDALAAALVMPWRPYLAAARSIGQSWSVLAQRFVCTESAVALRWGEVVHDPLVLIAPRVVRVRGAPWTWPHDERQLRGLAKASRENVSVSTLDGDHRRVLLIAV